MWRRLFVGGHRPHMAFIGAFQFADRVILSALRATVHENLVATAQLVEARTTVPTAHGRLYVDLVTWVIQFVAW